MMKYSKVCMAGNRQRPKKKKRQPEQILRRAITWNFQTCLSIEESNKIEHALSQTKVLTTEIIIKQLWIY